MVNLWKSIAKDRKGQRVWVEGDSSVGIPGYDGEIVDESDGYTTVRDKHGNIDEVPTRYVKTEKELQELNDYGVKIGFWKR